jgi:hypothetical protein
LILHANHSPVVCCRRLQRSAGAVLYPARVSSLSEAELDALVAEAAVDCYDEHEQLSDLFVIQDHLAVPFGTEVPGEVGWQRTVSEVISVPDL